MSSPIIESTTIPLSWLQHVLQQHFKTDAKIDKCEISKSGNVGTGYVSKIVPLTLKWSSESEELPVEVLLKILTTENRSETINPDFDPAQADWPLQTHINECHIYERYAHLSDKLHLAPVYHLSPLPTKFENYEIPPVMVMKFILNVCHGNVVQGLTVEQVKVYLQGIAHLHAFNLTEPQDWVDSYPFKKSAIHEVYQLMDGILNRLKQVQPGRYDEKLAKIAPLITPDKLADYAFDSHTALGHPPVIAHGDVWMNNLLWECSPDDKKKPSNNLKAILDWQICRPGSFMEDLALMLTRAMSPADRDKHLQEFFRHYIDCLTASLKELRVEKCPFTLEDCQRAYDYVMPFAVNGALLAVPFICEWNAKNMNEQQRESLFVNLDVLLDDLIAAHHL